MKEDELRTVPIVAKREHAKLPAGALKHLVRSVLERGVPTRFMAKGTSMWPFIRERDVIIVEPLNSQSVDVGEIAAFIHPDTGNLMVHRILVERDGAYLIKADNVADIDGWIPQACVLGFVRRIERGNRIVHMGLGEERRVIAWLSRQGTLIPILGLLRSIKRCMEKTG